MKDSIKAYNKKRSLFSSAEFFERELSDVCGANFVFSEKFAPIAIVIPACNEYPLLFKSLRSIDDSLKSIDSAACPAISVVCVVNNKASACDGVKENNRKLLEKLRQTKNKKVYAFSLSILDCASAGREMSENQGVGWARKYGMDYAVFLGAETLACMDADTLVGFNYIQEIMGFYKNCHFFAKDKADIPVGAIFKFKHQKAESSHLQAAIDAYEGFIKNHSAKLKQTGTPYWPWALSPAILCSAGTYAACGGMNKKVAGEDFYFLQALIKLHIQKNDKNFANFPLLDCTVYPSARYSDRVLFGTGQKLRTITSSEKISIEEYPNWVYEQISGFLNLFLKTQNSGEDLLSGVKLSFPKVYDFLAAENFFDVWEKLYSQNRLNPQRLKSAFHTWFDALKILRLIHYLMR